MTHRSALLTFPTNRRADKNELRDLLNEVIEESEALDLPGYLTGKIQEAADENERNQIIEAIHAISNRKVLFFDKARFLIPRSVAYDSDKLYLRLQCVNCGCGDNNIDAYVNHRCRGCHSKDIKVVWSNPSDEEEEEIEE